MTTKKLNPWDVARKLTLERRNEMPNSKLEKLEPDVNFFVLALEAIGCRTAWSCAGHPGGFYIEFRCKYALAELVASWAI